MNRGAITRNRHVLGAIDKIEEREVIYVCD